MAIGSFIVSMGRLKARRNRECGLLPLPKGEGWGEGLQTIDKSDPPHPNPLPDGERESRRAAGQVRAPYKAWHQRQPALVPRTIGWPMPSGLASISTNAARATSLPRLTQA